jgi:hypothetical protein
VELRIVDQQKPQTECVGGAGHCRELIEGATVRVFDRNDPTVGKNPAQADYAAIWDNGEVLAECTTDVTGGCTLFEPGPRDYLVLVSFDAGEGPVVVGKPKGAEEFVASSIENVDYEGPDKEFQVIKSIRKNGMVQYSGGVKVVVLGSYLEIVHPDYAIWEDREAGYIYPFIFMSDSDWEVDLCAQVPEGYAIVGVYDEHGDLVSDDECAQTFVAGEVKVVAYEVVDLESPEPTLTAQLSVGHPGGAITHVDVEIEGVRLPLASEGWGAWTMALAAALVGAWALAFGGLGVAALRFARARLR